MTAPVAGALGVIEQASGVFVDVVAPDPDAIRLEDVAGNLANLCRFGGACRPFYSVAEHAVLVADKLRALGAGPAVALAGLHHDDAEAYLLDVPRPVKPLYGDVYRDMTARFDAAIVEGLGLPFGPEAMHAPLVKAVDDWACKAEAERLLPSGGDGWALEVRWRTDDLEGTRGVRGFTPDVAAKLWLARHRVLSAQAQALEFMRADLVAAFLGHGREEERACR